MADTKKCPKCGGSLHTKIAGNYICSQCGNAIPESEAITVTESAQTSSSDSEYTEFASSASRAGNYSASGDSSYTDFTASKPEPEKPSKPKKEKVKKETSFDRYNKDHGFHSLVAHSGSRSCRYRFHHCLYPDACIQVQISSSLVYSFGLVFISHDIPFVVASIRQGR